ncbi:hypothetical protein FHX45_004445 [Amycolatopsis granulosa]|nr:hypothetical protein [Amycolatopsis granulosa]
MWPQPRARQAPGARPGYRSPGHGASHRAISAGHRTTRRSSAGWRPQHLLDPFRGTVGREHGNRGCPAGARCGDGGGQPHGSAPTTPPHPQRETARHKPPVPRGPGAAALPEPRRDRPAPPRPAGVFLVVPLRSAAPAFASSSRSARVSPHRPGSRCPSPSAPAHRTHACEEPIHGDAVPTVRVGFAGRVRPPLRGRLAASGRPGPAVVRRAVNPRTDSRWHSGVLAARRWRRSAPSGEAGRGSTSVTRKNCIRPPQRVDGGHG